MVEGFEVGREKFPLSHLHLHFLLFREGVILTF